MSDANPFYLEQPNKTRMVKDGMDKMHAQAKLDGKRQHACVAGVPFSCYPSASGAILWRANGFNYSRNDLAAVLVRRTHFGIE